MQLPIDDGSKNAAGFNQLKTFCDLLIECFVSLKECVRHCSVCARLCESESVSVQESVTAVV